MKCSVKVKSNNSCCVINNIVLKHYYEMTVRWMNEVNQNYISSFFFLYNWLKWFYKIRPKCKFGIIDPNMAFFLAQMILHLAQICVFWYLIWPICLIGPKCMWISRSLNGPLQLGNFFCGSKILYKYNCHSYIKLLQYPVGKVQLSS